MGQLIIRLAIFLKIGNSIQVYLISSHSGQQTDHYLLVAKVRDRLAVNKQRLHRFHMERFNLKKLNKAEGKMQ
jgi:hypothetical protein